MKRKEMRDGSPFLTIITVTKNCSSKIKLTVDSLLKQSFADFEMIIKDGMSTDDTLSYIPEDERIRLISAEDAGIYNAMNEAFDAAKGRYVLFLNAGDYLIDDDVLDRVYRKAVENPDLIVYGGFYHSRYKRFYKQVNRPDKLYFYYGTLNHQTVFFPVNVLKRRPLYDEKYRIAGDYELLLHLLAAGERFENLGFSTSYYDSGISSSDSGVKIRTEEYREIRGKYYSMPEKMVFGFVAKARGIWNRVQGYR